MQTCDVGTTLALFNVILMLIFCVKWLPCHHSTVNSHIVDGGERLQISRAAVNILNKQSQTTNTRVGPPVQGFQLFFVKRSVLQNLYKYLGTGWIPWRQHSKNMRYGTWNVSLYCIGQMLRSLW